MASRLRVLLVSLLITLATNQGAIGHSFTGLGDLPGQRVTTTPVSISGDGSTVVGQTGIPGGGGNQAFRWTQTTGMVGLGDFPGGSFSSEAHGVSADGSVVVGQASPAGAGAEAFRWTQATGMVGLGFLPDAPSPGSRALDVSADGSVIVGNASAVVGLGEAPVPFRWTATDGMVRLSGFSGSGNLVLAASADGSVITGVVDSGSTPREAFLWTDAGVIGLGDLPAGVGSTGLGISGDGSTVVGGSATLSSGSEAFRWTQGDGMVGLGGGSSLGRDVSFDGSVIVGTSDVGAFIWEEANGLRSLQQIVLNFGLDLAGWTLQDAQAISDDGFTIAGVGVNPAGVQEAWIANIGPAPIPEPNAALLFAVGAVVVGVALRRRAPGSSWTRT